MIQQQTAQSPTRRPRVMQREAASHVTRIMGYELPIFQEARGWSGRSNICVWNSGPGTCMWEMAVVWNSGRYGRLIGTLNLYLMFCLSVYLCVCSY